MSLFQIHHHLLRIPLAHQEAHVPWRASSFFTSSDEARRSRNEMAHVILRATFVGARAIPQCASQMFGTPLGPGGWKNAAFSRDRSLKLTAPSPLRSALASFVKNTDFIIPRSTVLTTQ